MIELLDSSAIRITRGDSAFITIDLTNDITGEAIELEDGDEIKVQVRKAKDRTSDLIFDGKIVDQVNGKVWWIYPANTNDVEPGTYYYDMQLVKSSGDVFTFIEASEFVISADITV